MNESLLRAYIKEALRDQSFIDHLRNGLDFVRGDKGSVAAARQIASDWLEEVELRRGDLLHPGYVTQVERFVVQQWPSILEQFRGNKRAALVTMTNMLDTKFNELRMGD